MKHIKFNIYEFVKFNPDDELGLFYKEQVELVDSISKIDPEFIPDFEGYSLKLTKALFIKYEYLLLTNDNKLFGVNGKKRELIREELNDWFGYAYDKLPHIRSF